MTTTLTETRTDAQQQAETLHLLAQHLTAHPHLPPVDIVSGHLYLQEFPARLASALADWADTLDDVAIEVETAHAHPLDGGVIVIGVAAGVLPVRLSSEVRGLSATVGLPDPRNPAARVPVTTDDLRAFDDVHHPLPLLLSGELGEPDTGLAPDSADGSDLVADDAGGAARPDQAP